MRPLRAVVALFLLSLALFSVHSEELSLFQRTLLRDMETADRRELLDWAASLELSTRGSRQEVEDRILNHYGVDRRALPDSTTVAPPGEGRQSSLITIERARGSRFFDVEQVNERVIRFSGGVLLTVDDDGTLHTIEAEQISINVERNTLDADGAVTYRISRPGGDEFFRGHSISFNIESWEGVFISGITETAQEIEGDLLDFRIHGRRITRSQGEIIVVDDATVTSSPADPPNWSIRAGRIWILAPGEWAISNATLRVGRVPVFYFPFFFIPGDKVFFHPVAGTRTREGAFIQTTTYLFGQRQDADPPISILRLADAPDESEREIRGLFLRIPDTPPPKDPPGWELKVMADVYTTLGFYTGVAASLPGLGTVDRLDGRLGLGFSRNIYRDGNQYTSFYVEDGAARRHWNSGVILGQDVPFRYESELRAAHRWRSLSLSLDFMMLSDPYFLQDFGNRSENMDWGFLLDPNSLPGESTVGARSSYDWTLGLAWNPVVRPLNPWVQSASLSTVRTQLRWRDRAVAQDQLASAVARPESDRSPESRFFFLQSMVAPEVAGRIQGSLLNWRAGISRPAPAASNDSGEGEDDREAVPIRSPWESEDGTSPDDDEQPFRLPERLSSFPGIPGGTQPASVAISYSLQPGFRYDRYTDNSDWKSGSDVAMDWRYSTAQFTNRGQVSLTANARDRLLSGRSTINLDQRYQILDYSATERDEAEEARLLLDSYRSRSFVATQASEVTVLPLLAVEPLRESSLRYSLNSRLYRRVFRELDDDRPVWDESWGRWERDDVSQHQARGRLSWPMWQAMQSFTATSDLPPRDHTYLGNLRLVTGPMTTTLAGGIRERDDQWVRDPLVQTHQLGLFSNTLRLDQRLSYDLEETELTQSSTSLSWRQLAVSLTGQRTTGFSLVPDEGWVLEPERIFRWTRLRMDLAGEQTLSAWYRRVALSLRGRASLDFDLLRFTAGSIVLDYGMRLHIHRFLNFELSARSRNDRLYQYIPALADEAGVASRSFIEDITSSLRFLDRSSRERSNFNLETLSFSLIHDLQDWELSIRYTGAPELRRETGTPRYEWSGVTVIMVRWRPITELERVLRLEDGSVLFAE